MPDVSPGSALRKIQQAQAGMKKARRALRLGREADVSGDAAQRVLRVGWTSLVQALRLLSEIPLEAANDAVLTKQLAAQRYATALLVRLRRVVRNEGGPIEADDDDFDADDEE